MEHWADSAIVLAARPHGEGAVARVLTAERGPRAGYVYGSRAALEPGTIADAAWRARAPGALGTLTLEVVRAPAALIAPDPGRLAALRSACALCDAALPEGEPAPGVFDGLAALLAILCEPPADPADDDPWGPVPRADLWPAAYVFWEVQLLAALGFPLELERCAAGGEGPLTHVSPRTGRAVSAGAAAPYAGKLLELPGFLRPERAPPSTADVAAGLRLTGYFLEHKALAHDTRGPPSARAALLAVLGGGTDPLA
jgi:DNA repair protein RecO (recombination protein O)